MTEMVVLGMKERVEVATRLHEEYGDDARMLDVARAERAKLKALTERRKGCPEDCANVTLCEHVCVGFSEREEEEKKTGPATTEPANAKPSMPGDTEHSNATTRVAP